MPITGGGIVKVAGGNGIATTVPTAGTTTVRLASVNPHVLLGNGGTTSGNVGAIVLGSGLSVAGWNGATGTLAAGVPNINGGLILGNAGTVAATPSGIAIGTNLSLTPTGTLNATAAAVAANAGAVSNSGTVQINNSVSLAGTAAGTLTIAPTTGTSDVIVALPAGGGTVTVAAAPSFVRQRAEVDFKHGATASVIVLNSGFVFGTSGGPTSFTAGTVANLIDRLMLLSPDGTKWAVLAVAQGFTS